MAQDKIRLSEERMGEIALMYLRNKVRKDSISLNPNEIRRQAGNTAKELGLSSEEALKFVSAILFEAFYEVIDGLEVK